jgi:hypothetical protein
MTGPWEMNDCIVDTSALPMRMETLLAAYELDMFEHWPLLEMLPSQIRKEEKGRSGTCVQLVTLLGTHSGQAVLST